eukprot:3261108-Amphidinium_carterae.1
MTEELELFNGATNPTQLEIKAQKDNNSTTCQARFTQRLPCTNGCANRKAIPSWETARNTTSKSKSANPRQPLHTLMHCTQKLPEAAPTTR